MATQPTLVSGIQPSGKLHIGNYLGALRNFVELQNSGTYHCIYFIADLHSLTEDFNPKEKRAQIIELTAEYIASGLDPKQSIIFQQSLVKEHAELTWILNTLTPMGELSRMTQFKDKSERMDVNVGLFDYPVLMASDIVLYGASVVPVGDDQLQHVEFTRTIVRKFNNKFGQTFIEPKALLTPTPRIMSLDDPTRKMSKSMPKGCLYISDDEETIREKIKSAVTDSQTGIAYDESRAGLANLLRIYSAFSGEPIDTIVQRHAHSSYVDFKHALADVLITALKPIRENKEKLMKNPVEIEKVLVNGAKKAQKIADKTYSDVSKKIGIL